MEQSRVADAFSAHADAVLRAAWHITGDRGIAEDCAQEAFLRLMQQKNAMTDAHILPWLLRTAMNLAKDYVRSAEHARTVPLSDHEHELFAAPMDSAERTALRAMQKIPEKYRVPMQLHFVEGYTIQETARLLGLGMNTTASRIRRGRTLLQKAYEEEAL